MYWYLRATCLYVDSRHRNPHNDTVRRIDMEEDMAARIGMPSERASRHKADCLLFDLW